MADEVKAEVIEEPASLSVTYTPATIDANFDALEDRVRKMVADYEGAVYDMSDPEDMRQAQRDRKYLNGIVSELESRRKAVAREYKKPLDAFEDRCKAISKIAKDASDAINSQLKEAEQQRKNDLKARLAAHYQEFADLLAPVVPYQMLHEDRWLNKSFGEVKAQKELEKKVIKASDDWGALKSQKDSMAHYDVAERTFFKTLDLSQAFSAAHEADEQDAAIEAMKQQVEPEAAQDDVADSAHPIDAEPAPVAPEPCPMPQELPPYEDHLKDGPDAVLAVNPPREAPKAWTVIVPSATRSQMLKLAEALKAQGITGRICHGSVEQVAAQMRQPQFCLGA